MIVDPDEGSTGKENDQESDNDALLDGEGGSQVFISNFVFFLDQGGGKTDVRKISHEVDDGGNQKENPVNTGVEENSQPEGGGKRNQLDNKCPGDQGGDALDRAVFDFGNVNRRFEWCLSFRLLG